MKNPVWHKIHSDFKLNGVSYSPLGISKLGNTLVNEGNSFETAMGEFLLDWLSDKPTLTVLTSGSTGTPKSIKLKKEHMVNSALATGQYFKLREGTIALLCLPFSGIAGKMMLVRAMVLGWQLDYVEPSSTPLLDSEKKYDFAAMVPLQVQSSLKQLYRVDLLIIGGAPVNSTLKKDLQTLHTNCFETYGMTETITHIAVKAINGPQCSDFFQTLPGVQISTDKRGCLTIEAPDISDEKVVTNDLVSMVSKNKFEWLGRYDSIINSGGIKLVPEQIERKLAPIIPFRFFVAGLPDKVLGHRLVLIIEGTQFDKENLFETISSLKSLNKYEVPKEVFNIKSFVETKSNKVDRTKTLKKVFS
ncbi:O-succinylbenzoic acid--CoA ligase [Flagellimonas alvinocaridis]|uniref:O-succinylbenzoic acid--CoA ligase n=1 Tax=Flagellimonas alvinocaridis TaxID=2530200 RepID=A0A4S8RI35_9FLAO|nr:AMP-binding protein [Allomuricauda alvinocaridis]THV57600.1 O-succinylbenzoic acid--CoA ligase [Allomuricauda alvinocaridis]